MKKLSAVWMALCIIATANAGWGAEGDIVYDNTVNFQGAYLTDIFSAEPPLYKGTAIGDLVSLEGEGRYITQFETILRNDPEEKVVYAKVRLALHKVQLRPQEPGRRIWRSTWKRLRLSNGEDQIVSFEVPSVRVPSSFVWTLEFGGPFDAYVARPAIPFYDPPVVGDSAYGYYYFNFLDQDWHHLDIGGTSFYAKIWAAQEAVEEDSATESVPDDALY